MLKNKINANLAIKLLIAALIIFSLTEIYYVMIVEKSYTIITNPNGPDLDE